MYIPDTSKKNVKITPRIMARFLFRSQSYAAILITPRTLGKKSSFQILQTPKKLFISIDSGISTAMASFLLLCRIFLLSRQFFLRFWRPEHFVKNCLSILKKKGIKTLVSICSSISWIVNFFYFNGKLIRVSFFTNSSPKAQ